VTQYTVTQFIRYYLDFMAVSINVGQIASFFLTELSFSEPLDASFGILTLWNFILRTLMQLN